MVAAIEREKNISANLHRVKRREGERGEEDRKRKRDGKHERTKARHVYTESESREALT